MQTFLSCLVYVLSRNAGQQQWYEEKTPVSERS